MSSKADNFDVRYRDPRDGAARADVANGGQWSYDGTGSEVLGGTVDYDLGYDANGWDTQGFRSPTAGYPDNRETARPGRRTAARPAPGGRTRTPPI